MGAAYFDYLNTALLELVGSGHTVLDVGCGAGAMGEAMERLGNKVTGVDLDEQAIVVAGGRMSRALVGDVTDVDAVARSAGTGFDRIVFADVLEHLPDPAPVLARYRALLAPGGRLLISLPNVAAWTVRLSLLCGRFEYAESGILDRTHLRFFTRGSARRMIEEAGYTVERRGLTPHLVRALWPLIRAVLRRRDGAGGAAVLDSPAYRIYRRWVEPVETLLARLAPGLLACQFVFEAAPAVVSESTPRSRKS